MKHDVYAMDTFFYSSMGVYGIEARAEMTKELGYDGTYLSVWDDQAWQDAYRLQEITKKYGLKATAVYIPVDLSERPQGAGPAQVLSLLERIEGTNTIELSVPSAGRYRTSDPAGDPAAIAFLELALDIAKRRNLQILLYSHYTHWMERHDDALRLCRRIDHPNLGIVFGAAHWFITRSRNLDRELADLAPYLRHANLAGLRKDPNGWAGVGRPERIDEGDLDNFIVLGALDRVGFEGPIGFQGFGLGGDPYLNLEHALRAYRDMERRVQSHPQWTQLVTGE